MDSECVVIIDDDASLGQAIGDFLECYGYRISTASSGGKGLRLIGQQAWDVAIVDAQLPDIHGTTVTRTARRLAPDTPIIMISADDSQENVVRCLASGATHFLAKPLNPEVLLSTIRKTLDTNGGFD